MANDMTNDMTLDKSPLPDDVGKLEDVVGPDQSMIDLARLAVKQRKIRYWKLGYKTRLISKADWHAYLASTEVPAKA